MIEVTFRPIDAWPGELARHRQTAAFTGSWSDTLDTLDRELRALDAKRPVVQLALTERDIRNDGWPRSGARPDHPGVVVAFDSRFGPLKYATDRFERGRSGYVGRYNPADGTGRSYREAAPGWQCNLRAIALGLEALRKVDRYGITSRGEQYTGWKALPSGIEMPAATGFSSTEDAAIWMLEVWESSYPETVDLGLSVDDLLDGVEREDGTLWRTTVYRDLARKLHPDKGGTTEMFHRLEAAREMVGK